MYKGKCILREDEAISINPHTTVTQQGSKRKGSTIRVFLLFPFIPGLGDLLGSDGDDLRPVGGRGGLEVCGGLRGDDRGPAFSDRDRELLLS